MSWLIPAIAATLFWAGNNIIDKVVLEKYIKDVGAYTALVGLFNLAAAAIVFAFVGFKILPLNQALVILTAGLLGVFWFLPYFRSLSLEDASNVMPITQTIPVFAFVFSYLFLGETLSFKGFLGFAIVIFGSLFLATEGFKTSIFKLKPAYLYMLLASVLYSATGTLFKIVAVEADFWTAFGYESLGTGIGGLLLLLIPKYAYQFSSNVATTKRSVYSVIAVNEVMFVLGRVAFNYALILGTVALATAVGNIQSFFVFILGAVFTLFFPKILKEGLSKKVVLNKIISIFIIYVGLLLASY